MQHSDDALWSESRELPTQHPWMAWRAKLGEFPQLQALTKPLSAVAGTAHADVGGGSPVKPVLARQVGIGGRLIPFYMKVLQCPAFHFDFYQFLLHVAIKILSKSFLY